MTAQRMTTTRDRVSLVKPCRAHGCTLLPRPDRVRLCTPHAVIAEQRIALGDLAHHIARRLGTTYADVLLVGDAMDAVAIERDRPDLPVRHCPQSHALTADNLVRRADGRRECLTCKRDRSREFGRILRAKKKAS